MKEKSTKNFRPKGSKPGGKFNRKPGGGGFKSRDPGRGRPVKRKKKFPPEVVELAKQHNIPLHSAFSVQKGKITLESVLEQQKIKEERSAKAQEICDQHSSISFAVACALVKDGVTPEEYFAKKKEREKLKQEKDLLKKKRMQEDLEQNLAYKELSTYCKEKVPLILAKYSEKFQDMVIEDFTPYEFIHKYEEKLQKLHRLDIKYMFNKKDEKQIKRFVMVDKAIRKKKLRPSHGPDGRFKFPDGVLQEGAEVMLALHEGEMIRGIILWFTPYDVMLKIGKSQIWVFRHAVAECMAMKRPARK